MAWLPTVVLSVVAGGLVALIWMDARDDSFTVAVGIGVFVMATGAVIGLIGGILMRAPPPKRG